MKNIEGEGGAFANAVRLHQTGEFAGAIRLYRKIIRKSPRHADALNLMGLACFQAGQLEEAVSSLKQALALKPDLPDAHYNLGRVLQALGRHEEAAGQYERALAQKPDDVEALGNLGTVLKALGRHEQAIERFLKALALKPDHAESHLNLGNALQALDRHEEAIGQYERALALKPLLAEAHINLGNALMALGRREEALARFNKAIALNPNEASVHYNFGNALMKLERFDEAIQAYARALALKPDDAEAHINLGSTLKAFDRPAAAIRYYDRAIAINPDLAEAHYGRGQALHSLHRISEAIASFQRVLALRPDHQYAFGCLAANALDICDWSDFFRIKSDVVKHVTDNKTIIQPFDFLMYSGDPALQLKCARNSIRDSIPELPQPPPFRAARDHGKLRVAYLSADFNHSSSSSLFTELFELHDRSRFEITGVSFGSDDESESRARVVKSFDRFVDVRFKSDREAAEFMREIKIDIAVDLKGHTAGSRLKILAERPAPVQATYLGFQGTTGAEFIDYVIGDKHALPFELQPHFSEKIVHLPDCHQVTDTRKQIPSGGPGRRESGLPEDGFVFCSFNDSNKINPDMFDIWMRLLKRVEGSVLWLNAKNETLKRNLCAEASARGVDPARLAWGKKVEIDEHLARHRLADLYLDTLPFGAHTSASRTLWAGLPILTCVGSAFAGRITASLLHAIGLPELVARGLEEYEAQAVKLATDAALLKGIRRQLEENRRTSSLFDTGRFRRHLEKAYGIMWERSQRGEAPQGFSVEPL